MSKNRFSSRHLIWIAPLIICLILLGAAGSAFSAIAQDGSATNASLGECNATSTLYSAEYLKNGTDHLSNYLTTGDIVKMRFESMMGITQAQVIKVRLIPKHGVVVPVDLVTPDVISTERIILYP